MNQLRNAANVYKRAVGLLFLPEPPGDDEVERIRDFRRILEVEEEEKSPALRLEIRLAYERRHEAIELASRMGEQLPTFRDTARLDEEHDTVGARIRALLGVSSSEQSSWSDQYEAFNVWRASIERLGILVFQTGGRGFLKVSPLEVRGFSITDRPLPVIVANSKDSPAARCFTLMHELTHVLLRNGGLCDFHERGKAETPADRVEVFCNRVAAAALVPAEELRLILSAEGFTSRREWQDFELSRLSRRFWVSWEVMLLRLLAIGRTTRSFYEEWKAARPDFPEQPGFLVPADRAVMRNGRLFTRLVLSAHGSLEVTLGDVSYFLGEGPQHLPAIMERAFDSRYVA